VTVLLFMPRFHAAILDGTKRQTIRRARKRPIEPGEPLSLRTWTDKPYRSKQRVLLEAECEAVLPIRLWIDGITGGLRIKLGDDELSARERMKFAKADGFESLGAMREFWQRTHGLGPHDGSGLFHDGIDLFKGECILWRPKP
jgi:hypothetical protein